ncbi:PDZ domain-containing protein [Kitasatospora sp. GP30]|uniref:S16 family serine protease n=1 Tax=Kitasatospora sp. GP30 TaxID=3035084 RepID=UPI000CBDC02C|nr:S16 family serine protease [Kitasatospora sp. GP30]MDH6142521.1 PDZ domain-containing protein [Kitasatospora sp. GP30]
MPADSHTSWLTPRRRALTLCGAVLAVLFLVAAFAPLPFTKTWPGATANALGSYQGNQVVTITGAPVRATSGTLLVTTILATGPKESISLEAALQGWLDPKVAVLPRDSVYPQGDMSQARQEVVQSQDSATAAALSYLHLSPDQVKVSVDLGDIGGPSGGQMLTLAIIDKLAGNGKGGDLTGGRDIAGTGTIDANGDIGTVGGVALKTQAAARDGASVFLVPRAECADAKVNTPSGLRLVPVNTLSDSVAALNALGSGGPVPSC